MLEQYLQQSPRRVCFYDRPAVIDKQTNEQYHSKSFQHLLKFGEQPWPPHLIQHYRQRYLQ